MITDEQMELIFAAVRNSPDANDFTKKLTILMIQKSEKFSQPVRIQIEPNGVNLTREILHYEVYGGIHDMISSGFDTKLTRLWGSMGVEYRLSPGIRDGVLSVSLLHKKFGFKSEYLSVDVPLEILTYEDIIVVNL